MGGCRGGAGYWIGEQKEKGLDGQTSAEEVRLKATEKLSATNKGNNTEENLVNPKKEQPRGGETVQFLREKSERDYQIR